MFKYLSFLLLVTTSAFAVVSTNQTFRGNVHVTGTLLVDQGTTLTSGMVGTNTNDLACLGCVGEVKDARVTTSTNTGPSGQYFDVTSVPLNPGQWECSGNVMYFLNGATMSGTIETGISATTGNSSTGLVAGQSLSQSPGVPTSASNASLLVGPILVSLTSTTTYFLKGLAAFSAGQPQYRGSIHCIRPR